MPVHNSLHLMSIDMELLYMPNFRRSTAGPSWGCCLLVNLLNSENL